MGATSPMRDLPGGGGLVLCVPKMVRPDFPDCKISSFPAVVPLVYGSLGGGGGSGGDEATDTQRPNGPRDTGQAVIALSLFESTAVALPRERATCSACSAASQAWRTPGGRWAPWVWAVAPDFHAFCNAIRHRHEGCQPPPAACSSVADAFTHRLVHTSGGLSSGIR